MRHRPGNISKKELAVSVAEKVGVTQAVALDAVDALFEEIKRQYRAGNRIEIRGFGTFVPVRRQARTYRVSRLGERQITIPEHTTIRLKPSRQMTVS